MLNDSDRAVTRIWLGSTAERQDLMDFEFTPAQRNVYETVGELARSRFAARAAKHDADATLPVENMRDLFDAGLFGITISEDLGGMSSGAMGKDPLLYLLAVEQLARSDVSTAQCFHIHCHGTHFIDHSGSQVLRNTVL